MRWMGKGRREKKRGEEREIADRITARLDWRQGQGSRQYSRKIALEIGRGYSSRYLA